MLYGWLVFFRIEFIGSRFPPFSHFKKNSLMENLLCESVLRQAGGTDWLLCSTLNVFETAR